MAKKETNAEISILELHTGFATVRLLGTTPLIFNRMSEKAKRELLMPKGRKSAADRAQMLKHVPLEEYRASVYRNAGDKATRLAFPAPGFKGAFATSALDIPGAKKTEIGRLTWVKGYQVDIFGVPKIYMTGVRSADMNKTPDIRTRAIVPEWACQLTIGFVRPNLNETAISRLIAAAGIIVGIGDFRQEKGKGDFGRFCIVDEKHPGWKDYQRIMKTGGRAAQDAALANPEAFDPETEELLAWFTEEVVKRGKQDQAGMKTARGHNNRDVEMVQ